MNKASNNLTKTNLPKNNLPKNATTNSTKNASSTNATKNATTNATKNATTNATKNATTNSQSSSGYSGTSVAGIVIMLIIIFMIAAASYWLYNYYTTKSFQSSVDVEILSPITDASDVTNVPSSTIPSSSFSNEYSISCWINVQDYNYNYGKEKVILRRGDAGSGNPEIVLDKKQNNIIVRVKLQGNTVKSVSKFQDIPIQIKSQVVGNGFITPESVSVSDSSPNSSSDSKSDISIINNMPDSFKKIGSNNIDYPTIHYTVDNNNITNSIESQCGYFDLISGNNVKTNPNIITNNGNDLVEGFSNADDVVKATVAIVVDMCNIANTIQDQQFADSSVESMNSSFQAIIDLLEESRKSAKSGADVNNVISSLSSEISFPTQQSNTVLTQQFTTLMEDINTLSSMSSVTVDYNTIFTAINSKMTSINCPLTIDSTTEIDGTISFYENIINLLKKSMFTYINNMGSGIKKIYPDLVNKKSANCLIDNDINKDPTVGTCIVKMIPLQKWVNIIVSVYNQIIDIYIDGQLTSSCVLKGFPAISTADANITPDGGFSGKISRVLFSNTAMTVSHAKQIYYSGPVVIESLFSMIPNWVYWTILVVIIIAIGYSFLM